MKNGSGTKTSTTGWTRALHGVLLLAMIGAIVIQAPIAATADPSATGATITSDQPDYPPGATVTLTGAGWLANESVRIVVNDTIGQTWKRDVTVAADAGGAFTDVFSLPNYFVSDYDVTATGPGSGSATTTFTDAQGSSSKPYAHWSDEPLPGDWNNNILNDNKSNYFEGEVIPHVYMYGASNNAQLVNGQSYSFNVTYNWYQQNTDAGGFVYMTQYNLSRQPTVFDWATPAIAPTADGAFTGTGMAAGASFYTVDADITDVSAATYTGTGTKDGHVTITFTYTGATTSNGYAAIYYGLYVAKPGEVPDQGAGKTNGANAWSGGSLQTTVDIGGSGATSIQLAPSAVIPGEISGLKFHDLNGNGTKDTGDPGLAGWTICLDSDSDATNGDLGCVQTSNGTTDDQDGNGVIDPVGFYFFSVTPGTYYVREVNQNGWTQTAPSSVYYGPLVVNATTFQYLNQNFGNRALGSLKLTKSLTGGPTGYTGPFTIHYNCGTGFTGNVSVAAGSSQTVSGIPSGTSCTVSEPTLPTPPAHYTFGTPTFSPSATVTIGAAGTTVEVTTNNVLTFNVNDFGNLKLSKSLTGGPEGFTGPFTIHYNCGTGFTGDVSVAAGSSQTINDIPTGTSCTISEPTIPTAPAGYSFGTPTFSPSATVTIGGNATVEVTTNNTLTRDTGNLKLSKSLTGGPNGYDGPFTIGYDCGTGFTGTVSVSAGGSSTVNDIPTGTQCTVSETPPTPPNGYTFGTPTFSPSATVTISTKDATVEVTTNNTLTRDTGNLKLSKSLTGGPNGYDGPFTIGYDCGTGFTGTKSVTAGSFETVTGIPTGTQCTVSETPPTPPNGYTFGTPTFSPSATVTISTKDATVEVTTNNTLTRDTGNLKLSKSLTGGPNGYDGPFTIGYDCGTGFTGTVSVSAGGSSTVNDIPTGTQCTVSETPPTPPNGYTFGTPTFSPSATVTISTKDATVEVTTNNTLTRDTGNLKLSKSLTGGPNGYDGPFTIGYDCGTGFTGTKSVTAGSFETVTGIPTGTQCTVSETPPTPPNGYTFGTPTFSPSATVTISTKDATVEVTTNNTLTRDTGNLKLSKSLTGGPNGYDGPFTIGYDCGTGFTGTKSVTAGSFETVTGIPTGTQCTVSETPPTPPNGYTFGTPTFSPSATVTISTKDATVEVTTNNTLTRDTGNLKLSKSLTGGPNGYDGPFTIGYDCGTGFTGTKSVTAGSFETVTGIPTGTQCTVSETPPTPPNGYTFGTPTFSPSATVTISTKDATVEVTTNNTLTRDLGTLKITKQTTGGPSAFDPYYSIHYDCGTGFIGNVSIKKGQTASVLNIPTGTECTVTENALPGAPTGYSFGTPTYDPASGKVTITAKGGEYTITVNNSLTRTANDSTSLVLAKSLTGGPSGYTGPFTIHYNCGGTLVGDKTVSAGSSASVDIPLYDGNGNAITTTCTVSEPTLPTVLNYTFGTPTFSPSNSHTFGFGANSPASFTVTTNNTLTRDRGTIIIIKNAQPQEGQFAFTTTGTGYNGFNLTGVTTGGSNINSQTLDTGNYTVSESTQASWTLTGIGGGGPVDPNDPFNTRFYCVLTVSGSGTSVGIGDLNTAAAQITLGKNDTVTCTFENTGTGATRTQGFWATHTPLAKIAWFGGTYGTKVVHTFPGVAATTGIMDKTFCSTKTGYNGTTVGKNIDTLEKLMGGFWSDISKKTTGNPLKRTALDQARMQLMQQLLAAELNASAFGAIPSGGSTKFAGWEAAYCGTDQAAISKAQGEAASFNSRGDSSTFTPGTSADSKNARAIANKAFWDILP